MTARVTFTNGNVLNASDLTNSFVYLPYAMESGVSPSITGTGTISFTSGRFSVAPIVIATVVSSTGTASSVTVSGVTTSGATLNIWSGSSASTVGRTVNWTAIQMTDTTAAG